MVNAIIILFLWGALLGAFFYLFYQFRKTKKEQVQSIQEIRSLQDRLIIQEKMAALGQLMAGIAHEIKNPLNFVHNFSEGSYEIAEDLYKDLQAYKSVIAAEDFEWMQSLLMDLKQNALDIKNHGDRISRIVESMMKHTRKSDHKPEALDINHLIEENVYLAYQGYRALEPSFDVNIQTNYDLSLQPLPVLQQDLGRVILNILNNACYALNQKRKALNNGYKPQLNVQTKSGPNEVEIRIYDNGPGIPETVKEQIFQPFFTTKPTGSGNTGLGLYLSREIIVNKHHGQLKVESEPGKFTEFIIILPKAS